MAVERVVPVESGWLRYFLAALVFVAIFFFDRWGPTLLKKVEPLRFIKHKKEGAEYQRKLENEISEWRQKFESGNFWIVLEVARKSVPGKVGDCRLISDCDSEEYPEHMRPRDLARKYIELRQRLSD